jgi:subtilisin-like proprotein convertase family protein
MYSLILTFNEPIDVSSFSDTSAQLTDPYGNAIPLTARVVGNSGDRQIQLWFSNQTNPGNYTLSVGNSVHDLMGNPLIPYQATINLPGPLKLSNYTAMPIKPYSTVTSTIVGPSGVTIGHLQIQLNIQYPVDSDLNIYLTAPNGRVVRLISRWGGNGSNFINTILDDAAPQPIGAGWAPYTNSYRPDAYLSQLNGMSAFGNWSLSVWDVEKRTGTLLSWSIVFTPTNASPSISHISSVGGTTTPSRVATKTASVSTASASPPEKATNPPPIIIRHASSSGNEAPRFIDVENPHTRHGIDLLLGKRPTNKRPSSSDDGQV